MSQQLYCVTVSIYTYADSEEKAYERIEDLLSESLDVEEHFIKSVHPISTDKPDVTR